MIRLDKDTRRLEALLGGAVSATQPTAIVTFTDQGNKFRPEFSRRTEVSTLNGATEVTICYAPDKPFVREIDEVAIRNNDSASVDLTVRVYDGGTTYNVVSVTLLTGETLFYNDPNGWGVMAATGEFKATAGSPVIADGSITYAKLQDASAGYTILAKANTGSGDYAELAAGAGTILGRDGSADLTFQTSTGTGSPVRATAPSLVGEVIVTHTATENGTDAVEMVVNGGGFGDTKALVIDYITGAIAAGEDDAVVLVNIDQLPATGGDVFGLEVLATEGSASVYGMKAGALVGPILQESGTFAHPTTGTNDTPSTDVPAMIDGSTGTTTTIFVADDDYIIIGAAAPFTEIEIVLQTAAAASIQPTFGYSTAGAGTFTAFSPVDGTNGFRNNGIIAWDAANLTSHDINSDTGTYDIKITRTRNANQTIVLYYAKTAATVVYSWDASGKITAASINKVAITAPATGSTLTIADGKTLTASNSLTLAGTDSTVMTFPTTSATIARTDAAQTFTGIQTFSSTIVGSINGNANTVTTNANLTGEVTSVGNAATLTNSAVIAKVLTGYTSGAGTVAATDSILQAIQKLNGNDATNANLTGPITSVGNATAVAAQTGTGSTFVMQASPSLTTPTINTAASVGGAWTAAATWTLPAYTLGGTVTLNGQTFSGAALFNNTVGGITTLSATTGNITTVNATTVNATTFDTNVAAAGVTLAGTTLAADGTDAAIDITITPKGTGSVVMSKVDINGGAIDTVTVGASSSAGAVNLRGVISHGESFSAAKFNSQGVAWSSHSGGAYVFNGQPAERPEIAFLRGSRTYPEFALRQHTTNDTGAELYVGPGTAQPTLIGTLTATGLNGCAVGATTPAAGTFTNLTTTGNSVFGNSLSDTHQFTGGVAIGTTTLASIALRTGTTFTTAGGNNYGVAAGSSANVSGTMLSHAGLYTDVTVASGTTITTRYGVRAGVWGGSGAVTTNYGLYIDSQTGGSTNWQLYSAGTANSYFGGNVGIGVSPTSGHGKLQVSGYIKHSGFADVRAYGAKADGTDDGPEIQDAIDALTAGGTLYFPPGDYTITTGLTCSGKSLKILGAGRGASRIIVGVTNGAAGNFLDFDGVIEETVTDVLQIQDITILAGTSERTYAIKADWTESGVLTASEGYRVTHCIHLDGVEIGNTGTGGYFKWGLYLTGAHNANISNCAFYGARQSDDAPVSSGAAIFMTGGLTPVATDATISNCVISRWFYGVRLEGEVEGTHITGCTILSCGHGIATDYASSPGPGLWVSDNHINCWNTCINATDASELIVTGNSFWSLPYNATYCDATGYGIYANVTSGALRSTISNNVFWLEGTSRTTVYCVYIASSGTESVLVTDNRFGMATAPTNSYAVYLPTGVAGVVVTDTNDYDSSFTTNVVDTDGLSVIEGYNTWTPTVTAGTGAFTTVAGTGWYYRKRNRIDYHMDITITTNGTAASYVRATLPIGTSAVYHNGSGRGDVVSGKMLQAQGYSSQAYINIFNYDGTYPGANTEVLRVSGQYHL